MRLVRSRLILQRSNLKNRRRGPVEVKVRLDGGELLNFAHAPRARQPPPRIDVKKDSTAGFQMFFNLRLQQTLGPAGADANRFPVSRADAAPVSHSDRLRAGDDDGVRWNHL